MTHENRELIPSKEDLHRQFEELAEECRCWEWREGQPPRDVLLDLIRKYHIHLVTFRVWRNTQPTKRIQKAEKFIAAVDNVENLLPNPFDGDFLEALKSVSENVHPDLSWLQLAETEDRILDELRTLREASRELIRELQTYDDVKHIKISRLASDLTLDLSDLFQKHAVLEVDASPPQQCQFFLELVNDSFNLNLPTSPRSQQRYSAEQSD